MMAGNNAHLLLCRFGITRLTYWVVDSGIGSEINELSGVETLNHENATFFRH